MKHLWIFAAIEWKNSKRCGSKICARWQMKQRRYLVRIFFSLLLLSMCSGCVKHIDMWNISAIKCFFNSFASRPRQWRQSKREWNKKNGMTDLVLTCWRLATVMVEQKQRSMFALSFPLNERDKGIIWLANNKATR